jgi:hypothetical protein
MLANRLKTLKTYELAKNPVAYETILGYLEGLYSAVSLKQPDREERARSAEMLLTMGCKVEIRPVAE